MKLIDKLKKLLKDYESQAVELTKRLDELSAKGLDDIYHDRCIALEYVNSTIEDLKVLLISENELGVSASHSPEHGVYTVLGNGMRSGETDELSGEDVKLPLGKRIEDGNKCPRCGSTDLYSRCANHYWCNKCDEHWAVMESS